MVCSFFHQCLVLFLLLFIKISESTSRQNILLILADDAGFEMGAYNNTVIKTPNLDKFAANSLLFTKAFASVSSCSPSRSAILTGRPNHWNGMYGLHNGVHHFNSFENLRSVPNLLSKHQIRTGIIGKKHIGPESSYKFDYEKTEEHNSILQVGRNITRIKKLVRQFLNENKTQPFFLYVAFHDPHRCGHSYPEYGVFCEKFGDGKEENGRIPDWQPEYYDPSSVQVPYYVQDSPESRADIAAQYTTISRMDQGVGLILNELERAGFSNNTLVIYSSDNGPPFPAGRTNLYDSGISVPLLIYSPTHTKTHGKRVDSLVSHLSLAPLIVEWFNIHPKFKMGTGDKSLMSILKGGSKEEDDEVIFASHSLHEVTMSYPMRAVRTRQFKLIHNLNYKTPFPIDQDFYLSPSFQDILKRTKNNISLNWYRSLNNYYYRDEWELFDLDTDGKEIVNLAQNDTYQGILQTLKQLLLSWQNSTDDPWICGLGAVLQDRGEYKSGPQCLPLYNGL